MLSSTSLTRIRPTEIERRVGRILRAPDHSAADSPSPADTPEAPDAPADTPAAETPGETDGSLMSDAKTDEGDDVDKADDDADKDAEDKPEEPSDADEGLPEKYELEMPEGVELDQGLLDEATPVLHELGLGNEQAQKLVPIVAKIQETVLSRLNENFQVQATDWAKEAKADPVLGGGKWKETEHLVALAMDRVGPRLPPIVRKVDGKDVEVTGPEQVQEFRDLLAETKLGNHPTLIRMFRFFGHAISEDSNFIRADGAAPVKASREEVLYPDDVKGKN
jgi:hypothetical protein